MDIHLVVGSSFQQQRYRPIVQAGTQEHLLAHSVRISLNIWNQRILKYVTLDSL